MKTGKEDEDEKLAKKFLKTQLAALTILIMLAASLLLSAEIRQSKATSGRAIRLSSSRPLYQPQQLVTLNVLVTYNDGPVANKDVAFQIEGPRNAFYNFTVFGYGRTNESGLATFSFRVPWPDINPEAQVLGTWSAIATVDIAEQVVNDTTSFQVLWIIELINIETLNINFEPQTSFLRTETVVFKLTVINHATTVQTATITIQVQDAANQPIMLIELDNNTFQPGENIINGSAQIPVNARIGLAKAIAAAFTTLPETGGVACCPAISTTFEILTRNISIVEVTPSKNVINSGEKIQITVRVRNNGNETESPYITVYYDELAIDTKQATSIPPSTEKEVIFEWDTSGVSPGSYLISATAQPVEGEIEIDDNTFIDGMITILPIILPSIRDVAVTSVQAQPTLVEAGEIVQIVVQVKNLGSSPESFNVIVYYDDYPIAAQHVSSLPPDAQKELTFQWNTTGMSEGNYTIKAYIPPLPGEVNIENNLYVNGNVTVKAPAPVKIHDVAITNVNVSSTVAYVGDVIQILVNASNFGDFYETFNVSAYCNSSKISTEKISLNPKESMNLNFFWNTSSLMAGNYTIWASAEIVPGEVNLENNRFVDGTVTLLPRPPTFIRDIAVMEITVNPTLVMAGENVTIESLVANLGDSEEAFNLTIFYGEALITEFPLILPSHAQQTVTYQWNTTNVTAGIYRVWGNITILENENNTENNLFVDGTVTVKTLFPIQTLLEFLIPLAIVAGLSILAVILFYIIIRRRRRRKKKTLKRSYALIVHKHI